MADADLEFIVINLALYNLQDVDFVLVGQDTDGNFEDCSQEDIDGAAFLKLVDVSLQSVDSKIFAATNNKISSLNVIKLIQDLGDETYKVLAYRPLGYTLPVLPSEEAELKVIVNLSVEVSEIQTGSIQLNYLEHSKKLPQEVHPDITELPIENPTEAPTFARALENKANGLSAFTGPTNGNVWRSQGTTAYYYGTGHTYSDLIWYYWQPLQIISFLEYLTEQMPSLSSYITSIKSKLQNQSPYVGFNARYGSYLYWYNISADYICVIYAGSMHFNNVDVFIVENNGRIQNHECTFYDNDSHTPRIKINRWYNNLYFVADNKAWQINVDVEEHSKYQKTVKNYFNYKDSLMGDCLIYNLRAFQTDIQGSIYLDTLGEESATYYQLEFSDIGDVLVCSYLDSDNKIRIGYHNIFNDSFYGSCSLEDIIEASSLYDSENPLFNCYTIDDQDKTSRLWALYQTSLVHLQYFLKNNIKPVYMSEAFSVGWDSQYGVYLVLWKSPQGVTQSSITSRQRFPADWLDNCININQGQVCKRLSQNYLWENIFSGETSYTTTAPVAADRGVVVKASDSGFGCYREI